MAGVVTIQKCETSWIVRLLTDEGEILDAYEVDKDKLLINYDGLLDLLAKANINLEN